MPDATFAGGRGDNPPTAGTHVIVIGAGLSGLLAAVEAVRAGAHVRVIAQGWGQQMVTPGWISVCDRADDDVIAEVRGYAALHPDHPYGLVGDEGIVAGLEAFQRITERVGLPYEMRRKDGHNMRLITSLGAIQRPAMAPRGLAQGDMTGVQAPILLVGIEGWRDFYPELAVGNLKRQGIETRTTTVTLPDTPGAWDLWPGDLANLFDSDGFRAQIIAQVKPHLGDAVKVGFPAVLGMQQHITALDHLTQALGRPVFEIPTLPPSNSGVRLSNALRRWLLRHGVRVQIGHPVTRGIVENGQCTGVEVHALGHPTVFRADAVILATGGLYNGGIQSDVAGQLWEPLFNLPVETPPADNRSEWYTDDLLVPRGHPVHRHVGLRVDHSMRPLNAGGEPALENVYATGHMLAGFNPLTDGCAEGIALATAIKAVHAALNLPDRTASPTKES